MTLEQLVGAVLIALPFLAVIAFAVVMLGVRWTLVIVATCVATIGAITAGVTLLMGT